MMRGTAIRSAQVLACLLALLVWAHTLQDLNGRYLKDDAYMFYRYAAHFREGLGFSWNLDGVHTYGMTSTLWQLILLPFSLLRMDGGKTLVLASWMCGGMALVATAAAVRWSARSAWFRELGTVVPVVALPILATWVFHVNLTSGMETMLAAALMAVLAGLIVLEVRGKGRPVLTGLVAGLALLARPESALPCALMILLAMRPREPASRRRAVVSLLMLMGSLALLLLVGRFYFHSLLPLSFYVKSQHGYRGYMRHWLPFTNAALFLRTFLPFLLAIAVLFRRKDARLLAATLVPCLAIMLYLLRVTQIMGTFARYYLPYYPLLVVPALLLLDDWIASGARLPRPGKGNLVAVVAVLCVALMPRAERLKVDMLVENSVEEYSPVAYTMRSPAPAPPMDYAVAIKALSWQISPAIQPNGSLAASEVGYLGYAADRRNIIDLAGLNDTEIAHRGCQPERFLQRRPDVIWFPHDDYTYQRGILLSDPALLRDYDVYAGAFIYGLAVAKKSPSHDAVTHRLNEIWPRYYPGTKPADYLVRSVRWDPSHVTIPTG